MTDEQYRLQFNHNKLYLTVLCLFKVCREGKTYPWEVKYRLGDVVPRWVASIGQTLSWLSVTRLSTPYTNAVLDRLVVTIVSKGETLELGVRKLVKKRIKEAINNVCRQPIKPICSVPWIDRYEPDKAIAKLDIYRHQNPMQPKFVDKTWFDIANMNYLDKPHTVRDHKVNRAGRPKPLLLIHVPQGPKYA